MFQYITHKIFYGFLTLFGVITVIFFLLNKTPGDATLMMLGQRADKDQVSILKKKYGFDKPLAVQYVYYLNDISPISFHSNTKDNYTFLSENKYKYVKLLAFNNTNIVLKQPYLRQSFQKNGKNVSAVISETLPNTAILAIVAIAIAMFLGVLFGVFSALYKDSFFDKCIATISTIGMSVPSFFSAIVFAWLFGFVLHKYTHLAMTGSLYEVDNFGEGSYIQLKNLILPAFVLGIRPLAVIIQLTRNSLLETLNQDYIRTAKAKGLSKYETIKKHALKNSLNPVVTAVSGWFASMLAGAVFVEYIYNWNGIGKELINALNMKDYPVIIGISLLIASLFILINIFVDIIYSWLDPRIKFN